jgi:hypothetical protein
MIRAALTRLSARRRGEASNQGFDELDEAIGPVRMLRLLDERFAKFDTCIFPLYGDKFMLSKPYGFTRTVASLSAARGLLHDMEADAQASAPPDLWKRARNWPAEVWVRLRFAYRFLRLAIQHRSFRDAKWVQDFEGAPWV